MRPLPFGVKAHFDLFLVLIYAVDPEKAAALLPPPFVHETYNDKAIMAAAFVKAKQFRPSFFPFHFGLSFNLAGFRHMVTYTTQAGKTIRGLKIIRSVANKKIMVKGGSELTQYKFQYNPSSINEKNGRIEITGNGLHITAEEKNSDSISLPAGSIFDSWSQARKFGGPLMYTFEALPGEVSVTEGSRKYWKPIPVHIVEAKTDFFDSPSYQNLHPVLSAAYIVKNIPYSWKKAIKEKYHGGGA